MKRLDVVVGVSDIGWEGEAHSLFVQPVVGDLSGGEDGHFDVCWWWGRGWRWQ